MPFVGNPPALRAWAKHTGLPPLPEQARLAFLHGAPGQVFDASAAESKLVLVSSDDGICSAVTAQAPQLIYRLVIERDDAQVSSIHDREYLAAKDKVGWRILAATVKGAKGGEAMLTAAPE